MKTLVKERPYLIPSYFRILKDEAVETLVKDPAILEDHFNDVYKLYLRRLAHFEMQTTVNYQTENELASILSELLRVKRLLQEEN